MSMMFTRPELELPLRDTGSSSQGSHEFVRATTVIVGPSDTCDFITDGVADDVTIDLALNYVLSVGGGEVILMEARYVLAASINIPGNELILRGFGVATFIDGDALADNVHAIVLSGFTDCVLRDFSIQTNDGGGLNCDCIFIEDGSNRFVVDGVVFVDSDRFGVNMEGTAITGGIITNCIFLDTDLESIYGNPDAANNLTNIQIVDNFIAGAGAGVTEYGGVYTVNRCIEWIIANNIFSANDYAVVIDGAASFGIVIIGNICLGSVVGAFSLWNGDGHSLVGNIVDGVAAGDNAFEVGSDRSLLSGNLAYNGANGIAVSGNFNTATGNVSCDGAATGFSISGDFNVLSGNLSYNNRGSAAVDGFYLAGGATQNLLVGNYSYLNEGNGLEINGSYNSAIGNFTFQNGFNGILHNATDGAVTGNTCYQNSQTAAGVGHEINISAARNLVSCNMCTSDGGSSENMINLAAAGDNCIISGNFCYNGMGSGIMLAGDCRNNLVAGNYLMDNDDYGIDIALSTCTDNSINGNYVVGNGSHGIWDEGDRNSHIGNHIANNGGGAIYIEKTDRSIILGNYIYRNSAAGGTYEITLHGGTVTHCKIIGNYIDGGNRSTDCIQGYFANDILILSNYIADGTDGIDYNSSVDSTYIQGNHFYSNATAIRINNANCDDNVILWNTYEANGTCLADSGTNTILPSYSMPFTQGTTYISAAGNPWGWEIDAGGEFAIAVGKIPWFVTQVIRIKVVAVGLAAPGAGNYMRLELTGEGSTFDEVYTTEPIDVADKNNNEEAFAIDDAISWTFAPADDADIGQLSGNDRLQIKVLHEAAGNGDIATDATFSSVEVEYC